MPCGVNFASVDISHLNIGWEITFLRGNKHTHIQTDIHKGNNNEIKYAKDITAVKNNALQGILEAIRCFFYNKLEKLL